MTQNNDNSMTQNNHDQSTGYQIRVEGGGTTIVGGVHYHGSNPPENQPNSQEPRSMAETGAPHDRELKRLEDKRDGLQQHWNLCSERLTHFRKAYAIEAGAAVRFQLEQQIEAEEAQLTELEQELAKIEAAIDAKK